MHIENHAGYDGFRGGRKIPPTAGIFSAYPRRTVITVTTGMHAGAEGRVVYAWLGMVLAAVFCVFEYDFVQFFQGGLFFQGFDGGRF